MKYRVGGVPPDGGVQETVIALLPVKIALKSVGGLGAVVYDKERAPHTINTGNVIILVSMLIRNIDAVCISQ